MRDSFQIGGFTVRASQALPKDRVMVVTSTNARLFTNDARLLGVVEFKRSKTMSVLRRSTHA